MEEGTPTAPLHLSNSPSNNILGKTISLKSNDSKLKSGNMEGVLYCTVTWYKQDLPKSFIFDEFSLSRQKLRLNFNSNGYM